MEEMKRLENGEGLRFALFGDIDAGKSDTMYAEFLAAYETAPANVTFECEALDFIDSTTLGTFVKILKRVKTDGNALKLKGLQARIKKLFVICALDTIMEIE